MTETFTIAPADATISVTPYDVPYDGTSHTATGSATGVLGEDLAAGLDLSGTTHTAAGTYTADPWTFSDHAGNYRDASGTVDNRISSAGQVITFDPLPGTMYGSPDFTVGASASSGLAVTFSAAGQCTVTGTTVHLTAAGTCTLTATQAGDANWDPARPVEQAFAIAPATPLITWADPAGITYGTPLSAAQLDAVADVAGTFTYTPAAGTILGAGDGQVLAVEFTPDDTVSYTTATATVELDVAPADATISVTPYDVPYDGTSHTATGSATGVLGEDLAAGLDLSGTTHTAAGTYTADPWTFSDPAGNYRDASGTVDNRISSAGRGDHLRPAARHHVRQPRLHGRRQRLLGARGHVQRGRPVHRDRDHGPPHRGGHLHAHGHPGR